MKFRTTFFVCMISLCSALSWGQTWKLSETMTATLDDKGVLTVSTTASAEEMPGPSEVNPWWQAVSHKIFSVIIEKNITTIGEAAFWYCGSLTSVTLSNSIKTIGKESFVSCVKLESITIPNSVTTIGEDAFSRCTGLTSITIPGSVTMIEKGAFSRCTGLTSIKIPNSVTTIGNNAFFDCSNLKDVTVEWTTPLSNLDNIFEEVNISSITLHVPAGTKALYQAADVWKEFGTIVDDVPNGIDNIEIRTLSAYASSDGILHISGLTAGQALSIYSISGQLVYQGIAKTETDRIPLPVRGIYVVMAGNRTTKAIVK